MGSIYDEKELTELEQEENSLTEETLVMLFLPLRSTHSDLEKELRQFYQKYGKDGIVTYTEVRKWVSEKNHQRRLTWLLALLSTNFSSLFSKMRKEFETMTAEVIKREFEFFGVALDTPKLNWGVDDLTWLDRLADDITAWEAYVANDLKRGFLAKKNLDDILKTLDKRFLTMENITRRLAITETTAAGSITRQEIFKELGIKKYKYYAREDERTCEQCGSLHGLIFPISAYEVGSTAPPIHSHCRCWTVPIRE
jgi:SPP1 gp7 family putative phage head morphogenesis protein